MRIGLIILLVFAAAGVNAAADFETQQIEERIRPVGQVNVEEQNKAAQANQTTTKSQVSEKKLEPGQETYERYCILCHRDGVAGAPKFRDEKDWKAKTEGKKIEEILEIAKKGENAMPPKGTCVECSDEELKNAIHYMMPQS